MITYILSYINTIIYKLYFFFLRIKNIYYKNNTNKCKYYNNNNLTIYAECCNKYVCCRKCHNNTEDHKIKIYKIKCKVCNKIQDKSNKCINCNTKFAEYYCKKCNVWADLDRHIEHCDKCNNCIVSSKGTYHCDKCNICIPKNMQKNHICFDIQNCAICFEKLEENILFLDCSHILHRKCYEKYVETCCKNYIFNCPICRKTAIGRDITNETIEKMKPYFPLSTQRKDIRCNDCSKDSNVKYIPKFNMCKYCKSYNTYVL